ncbi:ATP-binding protein [Succinatimonas hippei]|uniref:ATP-binding protein n=1 Tax=Succinatimonas hippei TaxID=626938 RepID=UPI00255CDA06|nr:ATP-binding protein [Succinatimonas hippei]
MSQVIFNDIQTRLLSLCTDLGLEGFADGLSGQFENYQCFCDSSTEDRLLLLLQREKQVRKEKKILSLTKAAKLRDTLTYDALSLREADGLPKSTLQMLISNIWMHNAANIVVSGQCGVGKTALVSAVAYGVIAKGFKVLYLKASEFNDDVNEHKIKPKNLINRLASCDVLILDDFGYRPLSPEAIGILYEIIDKRHKRKSTIVSTQLKSAAAIIRFLGSDATAEGLVDRLCSATTINITLKGVSRRQQPQE